ncbi:glycine betaine ABC transporter substrate-binding protein [Pseudonocardia endophytica]|uniref:Osmoprotectant transport system substrate-binding protein n=1 Tax=Pseudonocardia endophytica TaxID=401976 RepID=A0A4R1HW07_PSEEN|nr:glycine betaine ABC transporter substrate-binding protein [Pseudonocardia endophytica]TCK24920.1 osmoprotectant transport system substrate-binding protein [Pseudonocardia endophytica]
MILRAVRPAVLWSVLAAVALLLAGCSGSPRTSATAAEGSLAAAADLRGQTYVVGGGNSDQERALCEVTVAALESARAGVTDRCSGDDDPRRALMSGEINVYWEDAGTAWTSYLRGGEERVPPDARYRQVADRDLAENGVVWLAAAGFEDSSEFVVAGPEAARLRLRTLSDMTGYLRSGQPATVCVDREYADREDGLRAVERTYGVTVGPQQVQVLDDGLVPQSTADGVCTFGEVSTTDGRVPGLGLTVLDDDRGAEVASILAPTLRKDAYDRAPAVARVLDPISGALDPPTVVALTRRVSVDGATPRDAAREWLSGRGFIGAS